VASFLLKGGLMKKVTLNQISELLTSELVGERPSRVLLKAALVDSNDQREARGQNQSLKPWARIGSMLVVYSTRKFLERGFFHLHGELPPDRWPP
jgi:hypothetical protein